MNPVGELVYYDFAWKQEYHFQYLTPEEKRNLIIKQTVPKLMGIIVFQRNTEDPKYGFEVNIFHFMHNFVVEFNVKFNEELQIWYTPAITA